MTTHVKYNSRRRGIAYVLALVLLAIFSTLAVAFSATTDLNLRKSENCRQAVEARLAAESGLAFWTYTLSQIQPPDGAEGTALVESIADELAAKLDETPNLNGATVYYPEGSDTITVPEISLGNGRGSFYATISLDSTDNKKVRLMVTGRAGTVQRTVKMGFRMKDSQSVIFSYGIATKGSVIMVGKAEIAALVDSTKVDMFSSYDGQEQPAFDLSGQVSVTGDLFASDPNAEIKVAPNTSIGGETNIDVHNSPHIHIGVDDIELPEPNVSMFEPFATNIMNDHSPPKGTYTNICILAGTNPSFSADTVLQGTIFVEQPNKVTFSGKVTIQGVIVTEDARDSTDTNSIKFSGQVVAQGVDTLPDEPQFEGLKEIPGVFLLAPGFDVGFSGQFGIVTGGMMADSITLSGQAGGTIKGPAICYDGDLNMGGLANLTIDQSGSRELPPCFSRSPALIPLPETYVEN